MKARLLYVIALAVLILDQVTKFFIEGHLLQETSVPVINKILYFTSVHNHGGAFGIFQSWRGMLTFVSFTVIAVIVLISRRKCLLPMWISLGFALQLGGATGNLIDRVRYGYVVDFIDLRWWPVFNIADIAITVGIACLAYHMFFCETRNSKTCCIAPDQTIKD